MFFGENLDAKETEEVSGDTLDNPELLEPTAYYDVDNSEEYSESILEDAEGFGVDLDEVEKNSKEDIEGYHESNEYKEYTELNEENSSESRLDEIRQQKEALLNLREELLANKDIDIDIDDTDDDGDQPYVRKRTR